MTLLSGKEPDLRKDPTRIRRKHVIIAPNVGLTPKASKRDEAKNMPKQDGQPNILVPETPDGAIRLPKPSFGVVDETPEMTSLFASAYASRPTDADDSEWETPAITEHTENVERTGAPKTKWHRNTPISGSSLKADRCSRKGRETELYVVGDKREAENASPRRKSQSTDRTHGRSKNFGTPEGTRKRSVWDEIGDTSGQSKTEESSSDTEREVDCGKPNNRWSSSHRKARELGRVENKQD